VLDVNKRLAGYIKWWELFDACLQVWNHGFSLFPS
jgi:hypothetical protein